MKICTALFTVTLAAVAGFVSSPINAELAKTEPAPNYQKIDEEIAKINRRSASKMANMENLSERERAVMQTNMVREGKRITTYLTFTTITRDKIDKKKLPGLKAVTERNLCKNQTIVGSDWFYRPDFTHKTVFSSSDGHEIVTASVGPFECETGVKLVKIPGGSFSMGSNDGSSSEKPVHTVSVKSFYMQEHEVTWAQYLPCIDAGVCWDMKSANLEGEDKTGRMVAEGLWGWSEGDRPVVDVSWDDVQTYISWLNKKTGKKFRLPSEAEWEYAARAGSTTNYSWGDDAGINRTNCEGCADYGFWDADPDPKFKLLIEDDTTPVKTFLPNAWGLYDMHGNASEWVQDCRHPSYQGAPTDGSAWISDGDCSMRALRGGAVDDPADWLHSASRISRPASQRDLFRGFRLAHDL